ncbi:helix-turn-helix domain-containing protein [Clostridium butyricum]|jgi:transcriptional regulator with XRE-family HTH domain|uniref:helix-turn-helix domain-containing protein n=1 Tax=Clostridium butyricum TaxID=1492 RepID=UPI00071E9F4F|nr:helix-turn-helix domain-containing protein [Clostridium butyricum]ALS17785.1 XRE family transcriptional regulator [Clostridium butyricum]MDB2161813.1 helix-turn-helix domain-containing protein [Clostridium butyricum]
MLGDRIKELREKKNLTQSQLSKILGVSPSTIGMWEQNRRSPDNESLNKIADLFNVSIDSLFGRTDHISSNESNNNIITQINIPKEYTDKYKITSRDKKQYLEEMKKANEAFFMNDELNEEAKKEMLDLMSELFWEAKSLNKRKK